MASYSYSSDFYDGDLCYYSIAPYCEPSPSLLFRSPAAYSLDGDEEDPGEEYPLSGYHDSYSSVQYQDSFAYGYNHLENPVDDHSLVPYYSSYNLTLVPDPVAYNWNDEFDHRVSYYQPDAAASWSRMSYSASALSEPKCITLYGESPDNYSVQTQFLISYNVADFNEPEDKEYDPTPYGGGYDIAATYGKPLSPSEETCYPRSDTSPVLPILVHPPAATEENPPADQETAVQILPSVDNDSQGKRPDEEQPDDGTNGNGNDSAYQVVPHQVPSGYGLETVDICESLFGPWPCLTRNYRRAYNNLQDQEECGQWNDAADYLFGSSYPYCQTMPPGDGHVHAYHRHNYQEDPLHRDVKYDYNSWLG